MTSDGALENAALNAMLHCAQTRASFDAAKIAAMLRVPLTAAIDEILTRLFWIGLLSQAGYRRHVRTGASVLYNVHSGDIAGTLGYAPPEDARTPEQMPADWIIEVHAGQLPTGILWREGERAAFDSKNWHGPDFAVGMTVVVRWKRSPCGWFNIVDGLSSTVPKPEIVLPPGFTLKKWLSDVARVSGKLRRVSARALLEAAQGEGMLAHWHLEDANSAERFTEVLSTVASLSKHNDAFRRHAGLVLSCIWLDDGVDESMEELRRMLGLQADPHLGPTEPYPAFDWHLALCNELAEREGLKERLYRVDGNDEYLVIKLAPPVFEALVAEGLLFAHVPLGSAV